MLMVKDLMKDLEKGNRVKEVLSKPKEKPTPPQFSFPQSATEMIMRQEAEMRRGQAQQQLAMPPQQMSIANNPMAFFQQHIGQMLGGLR